MATIDLIPAVGKLTLHMPAPLCAVYDATLETPHFYQYEYTHTYVIPGSPANVWVTFDVQSMLWEDDTPGFPDPGSRDDVKITTPGGFSAVYQRADLAGLTVAIPGDTFTIDLYEDSLGPGGGVIGFDEFFGFRIINISTTAPAPNSYLLGNRNGIDEPIIIQGDDGDSRTGFWAASHPSYQDSSVPVIMPQILPDACLGKTYSYQFVFPNAAGTVTWAITSGSLTAGITLNASTGILSGTPTTQEVVTFTIQATDTDSPPKSATGSFDLRVFTNPSKIVGDGGTAANPIPLETNFTFAFGGLLYSAYQDNAPPVSAVFPVVKSSADGGITWQLVNVGDTTSTQYGIDMVYDGNGHIIWAFWQLSGFLTLDGFNTYFPLVQSYDLLTNTYTTLFNSAFSITASSGHVIYNAATGDIAILQQGSTNAQNFNGVQAQLHFITALGTVDTVITTNLPGPAIQGNGLEIFVNDTLVDGTGAYHVFWDVAHQVIPSERYFYYRRVASDGVTMGALQLLDRHWLFLENSSIRLHGGYIRNSDDEIVMPFNYVPPYFGISGPAVLRGTPLSNPVFSYELIQCSRNNDHSNYSMMIVDNITGRIGVDGADLFFCAASALWETPCSSAAVVWLLVNPRDGTGWKYRELYYDGYNVPPFGQNTLDPCVPQMSALCPIYDSVHQVYDMAFYVGFGPFDGTVDTTAIMYLSYPFPSVVAPTCSLSATPTSIILGGSSTLTWTTMNSPDTAVIDHGVGSVSPTGGSTSVSPTSTTTYHLVVTNAAGSSSCQATVALPPTCSLSASPMSIILGNSSTLTWTTVNSPTTAVMDNGIGSVNPAGGSLSVSPIVTTTYHLIVTSPSGSSGCQATVTIGTPIIPANTPCARKIDCEIQFYKHPLDAMDFTINWAGWLEPGDQILTSNWNSDVGITLGATSITGAVTGIRVSGGTDTFAYLLRNMITTAYGITALRTSAVNVAMCHIAPPDPPMIGEDENLFKLMKNPLSSVDLAIDWSNWLGSDRIANFSFVPQAGITATALHFSGTATSARVGGGLVNNDYLMEHMILTQNGRTGVRHIVVSVRSCN